MRSKRRRERERERLVLVLAGGSQGWRCRGRLCAPRQPRQRAFEARRCLGRRTLLPSAQALTGKSHMRAMRNLARARAYMRQYWAPCFSGAHV